MRNEDDGYHGPTNRLASSNHPLSTKRFTSEFKKVSPIEYLNYDQRPTFVLDLEAYHRHDDPNGPLAFCNSALLSSSELYDAICRTFSPEVTQKEHEDERIFAEWVTSQLKSEEVKKSKVFFHKIWTVISIPHSWAFVSGVEVLRSDIMGSNAIDESEKNLQQQSDVLQHASSRNLLSSSVSDSSGSKTSQHSGTSLKQVWPPISLGSSAHITWIRDFDWASTSLGSIDTWSRQLKQTCEIMLANPDPATVFWGPNLILIYNEAYIELAGNKHPKMMGESARIHWEEVWDQYDPLFDQMRIDGKAFKQVNSQLFIHRSGYLEEGFFNMVVMPILDDDGSVIGFYEPVSEVTKQTLSERRMHTLLSLGERISSATSLKDLWRLLLEALSGHQSDLHFAVLYHLQSASLSTGSPCYHLEGSVGLGADMSSFESNLKIHDSDQEGIVIPLRQAHETGKSVLLTTSDGSLSSSIIQQLEEAGITEAPRACVIHPLSSTVDESVEAFLILGISPKRPYDEDYELFINLLSREVESTITFVKLFEKERERLKQEALYESELRFKKFAENAQVGIFSFDPAGNIVFCNESWLELTGHDRNDMSAMSWAKDVHPDNVEDIKGYWDKIVNLEGQQTFEVQYTKPWRPANLKDDSIFLDRTWVVASAYAEVSDEGELTGIVGCVTDISSWKWVDKLRSQRLSEALELKRQQENFLDITSHEMRNPLNAILHCAADLVEQLTKLSENMPTSEQASVLNECLDASRTIVYCGRHQKRIIDDVLTLSKLDSNLLSISPIETRPLDVVEEVLKVFDTEIRASNIQTEAELAESYKALDIETVLVDSHRVIQILINLVANAVKFTKDESLRSLRLVVGAYTSEPVSLDTGVRYVPSGRLSMDPTWQTEWGTGEIVFLHFSVQDTGPGMSREDADLLFHRFSQGSPRTHVQYGGSGLGLFISRELAELHGGRIGVSTKLGLGSTFDFYVKGRRSTTNKNQKSTKNVVRDVSLPQKPVSNHQNLDGALSLSHSSKSSPNVLQTSLEPHNFHVLIVEDNLINQKILAKLLVKQGYSVSIANHGEEALAIIHTSTWQNIPPISSKTPLKLDIVLADIEMPVMDGKEFVRHVRRLQNEGVFISDIPIIAVTGNARNEQVQLAKDCGFDDVLSKPYSLEDLTSRITKYMKRD